MREAAGHVDIGLTRVGVLAGNVVNAILRGLLTELHVGDLVRCDLISRELD